MVTGGTITSRNGATTARPGDTTNLRELKRIFTNEMQEGHHERGRFISISIDFIRGDSWCPRIYLPWVGACDFAINRRDMPEVPVFAKIKRRFQLPQQAPALRST